MIDQIINLGNKNIVTLEIAGQIIDLDRPSQVEPNTPFDINYGAKNISTTSYTFFGYLEDEIGIVPGTEWQMDIGPNDTYYLLLTHPGITESMTLTLTLGHHIEICDWITLNGGYDNLPITVVFDIIDAYLFNVPPPPSGGRAWTFIPTIENVFGIIDYYLGFNGDPATGCNYF